VLIIVICMLGMTAADTASSAPSSRSALSQSVSTISSFIPSSPVVITISASTVTHTWPTTSKTQKETLVQWLKAALVWHVALSNARVVVAVLVASAALLVPHCL
jgi:hypothetical protein